MRYLDGEAGSHLLKEGVSAVDKRLIKIHKRNKKKRIEGAKGEGSAEPAINNVPGVP